MTPSAPRRPPGPRRPFKRLLAAVRGQPWALNLGPRLAVSVLRLLRRMLRVVQVGRARVDALWRRGDRVIVTFWHGRLLMMPFAAPEQPAAILISQHRDGEYISRIAQRMGYRVIRGSATRGGARAFRQLIQALGEGQNVVVTPDGPKGPAGKAKPGAVELARVTGAPIVPVAFGASRAMFLRSWDRFLVPGFFARGVFVWGEPLVVPPEASRAEIDKFQQLLEERLDALGAQADAFFGPGGERRAGGLDGEPA